jgi:hypothetical protein
MTDPCRFRIVNIRGAATPYFLAKAPGGNGVWLGITSADFDAPGYQTVFERGDSEVEGAAAVRDYRGRWVSLEDSASRE